MTTISPEQMNEALENYYKEHPEQRKSMTAEQVLEFLKSKGWTIKGVNR